MGQIAEDVAGRWVLSAPAPKPRWRRVVGVIVPLVLVIALVGGSGPFITRGVVARDETSRVDSDTVRLSGLEERADARSRATERLARRIDQDLAAVIEAVVDVSVAQGVVTLAERDLVAVADAAVDQLNAGDRSAGQSAFRSEVPAAADRYEATLPALQDDIDAAADALAGLDVTLEAQP